MPTISGFLDTYIRANAKEPYGFDISFSRELNRRKAVGHRTDFFVQAGMKLIFQPWKKL